MKARWLAYTLALGCTGIAAFLAGLSLDAVLHAQDPALAETEGILTLTNPGHALMFVGAGMIMLSLLAATAIELQRSRPRWWQRPAAKLAALACLALLAAGPAYSLRWAATHEAAVSLSPSTIQTLNSLDISSQAEHAVESTELQVTALQSAARSLGMTQDQLAKRLAAGQTLDQVAVAQAVSPDDLAAAIRTAIGPALDQSVLDGAMSRAQADRLLQGDVSALMPALATTNSRRISS